MKKRALAVLLALCVAFGSPAYLSAAEQDGEMPAKQEEAQGEKEDPSDPDSGKEQAEEGSNTDTGDKTGEGSGETTDPAGGEKAGDLSLPEDDQSGAETENPVIEEEGPSGEPYIPGEKEGQDPESLFSAYVDRAFNGNTVSAPVKLRAAKKPTTGEKLTGVAAAVYAKIAGGLPAIAAGEEDSTVFKISPAEAGLDKVRWSAEDLGVARVGVQDNDGNWKITQEALDAFGIRTQYDLKKVVACLLADFPYELYWYDKTVSTSTTAFGWTATYSSELGDYLIYPKGEIKVSFPVADEFKGEKEYQTNTKFGESVQTAVGKAQDIVTAHCGDSDEDKLLSYKKEICDLVSYNSKAAEGGVSYGNPWQLIWVFDNNPTTNVVCEGYAKAFKYLCDQSEFDGDIRCITVTGTMSVDGKGERHMWNVVHMNDGCNYLVDVTNCDGDENGYMVGYQDKLFLTKDGEGSVKDGYEFWCTPYMVKYQYDSNAKGLYTGEELVIGQRTQNAARILAASVSFKDNIGLNYYIDIPDEYLEDSNAYIEYTINKLTPESATVPLSEIPEASYDSFACRKLTVDTVVKSIHDKITLHIYDGEGNKLPLHLYEGGDITQSGFEYSVADYCADIQEQSSNEAMKELAYKLEQYGLYVQKYLNYKADKAAPELDVSTVTADSLNAFEGSYTDDLDGLAYYGFSFLFKEASALRFKFTLADGYNIDDYTFTVDGKEVEPSFNGSQYVIQVSGIRARDLGTAYVVKVTDQEGRTQELNNSGISYAKALIERGSSNAGRDAARAMYLYYKAAENYFANR